MTRALKWCLGIVGSAVVGLAVYQNAMRSTFSDGCLNAAHNNQNIAASTAGAADKLTQDFGNGFAK